MLPPKPEAQNLSHLRSYLSNGLPASNLTSVSSTLNPLQLVDPERRATNTIFSACLLAFAGGTLDAFLYLDHDKVFAGAMTGNAVLAGIALLSHDHHEALHHLLPLAGFVLGVWGARELDRHVGRHAVLIGLSTEIVVLFVASWLPPTFPDNLFIFIVTIVCAYQVASFRTVDKYTYNSTFITGNLRQAISAVHTAVHEGKRSEAVREFRDLGWIIVCFVLGAVCGAVLAPRAGNRTLWLPVAALVVILVLAVRGDLYAGPEK
jgi:uncharacterized membrane protein YoaK (UPF0700 family)